MEAENVPGLSLYIVRNGQPDTTLTFGYRDRENRLPVEANTLFQMGGMSTALVKFAILKAVQRGELDLDQPANNYLKRWKLPEKGAFKRKPVTIRDLMLQRRGFKVRSKPPGYAPNESIPTPEQILEGSGPAKTQPVNLKRSKNISKNTSWDNAFVLQVLMEDVWSKPLDTIIQHEVLDPLEMTESTLSIVLTEKEAARAAVGYDHEGKRIRGDRWIYPERACANLWSTPRDYAKFVLHMYAALEGRDNSMISQELAQEAFTPFKEGDFRSLVFFRAFDPYWGGASTGFRSQYEGKPEKGFVIIGLANKWEAWEFMGKVMGMCWDYGRRNDWQ
jgi:CubicO group peptidase (beta-lactamase class C family)